MGWPVWGTFSAKGRTAVPTRVALFGCLCALLTITMDDKENGNEGLIRLYVYHSCACGNKNELAGGKERPLLLFSRNVI